MIDVLSAAHEPSTRIDWAELLKPVRDVDALGVPVSRPS